MNAPAPLARMISPAIADRPEHEARTAASLPTEPLLLLNPDHHSLCLMAMIKSYRLSVMDRFDIRLIVGYNNQRQSKA